MTAKFGTWIYDFARLLFVTALAGCTGYLPGLPTDYDVASDPNKGVIVGSVGTNLAGQNWREWSKYTYSPISDPKSVGYVASAVGWSIPSFPQPECPDDGLPAECANLFAILLPVGEYKFWGLVPAMNSSINQFSTRYHVRVEGYRFEVKSGQATYIGNMLTRLCVGPNAAGIARVAQGDVADMYERDVPLLKVKFPQLQNTIVNNETMPGTPWRWEWWQGKGVSVTANWESECAPVREAVTEFFDANNN